MLQQLSVFLYLCPTLYCIVYIYSYIFVHALTLCSPIYVYSHHFFFFTSFAFFLRSTISPWLMLFGCQIFSKSNDTYTHMYMCIWVAYL